MGQVESSNDAHRVLEMAAALRSALLDNGHDCSEAALSQLDAFQATFTRILDEHSGMAEELLRIYEQLGIVFDLTRKLATVDDENEVLRLYVESLRSTYPDLWVEAVGPDPDGAPTVCSDHVVLHSWVRDALQTCRDERRVVVADAADYAGEATAPGGQVSGHRGERYCPSFDRVLCGPVYAGETLVRVLLLGQVALREPDTQIRPFEASDMLLLDSLNVFCGDTIRNLRLLRELRQLSIDAIGALISAIEQKDEYTSGHSTRVGIYATMLGRELELDHAALQMLEWAALLHDVGKIGIRDEVLKKPGRLAREEFQHVKEHPVRSNRVVRQIPQLADALPGVTHHHEHWDGSGYPEGLAGEQIPLQARIIQVADIFDALTSTRSYRKAFDWPKALSILSEEAGQTVDPHLGVVFNRMVRRLIRDDPRGFEEIRCTGRTGPEPGPLCDTPPACVAAGQEAGPTRTTEPALEAEGDS